MHILGLAKDAVCIVLKNATTKFAVLSECTERTKATQLECTPIYQGWQCT